MRRLNRLATVTVGLTVLLLGSTLLWAREAGRNEEKPARDSARKEAAKVETKVEEKAAVLVPARPAGPEDLAEELGEKDPKILRWLRVMRPFVRSEYHIVVRVCEPTEAQRRKLAESFAETVRDAAKRWDQMREPSGYPATEPESAVPACVTDAIRPILTAEQVKRYQADIEARKVQYQRMAVQGLVAVLDHEMRFTAEQREKIAAALLENWDEKWMSSIQVLSLGLRYFPPIPDPCVEPYLDESQKTIWRLINKNSNVGFGIGNDMDNQVLEDALRKTDGAVPDSNPEPAALPN